MTLLATSVPPEQERAIPWRSPEPEPRKVALECVPLPAGVKAKPNTPKLLRRDLRTLSLFIKVYCKAHHPDRVPVDLKGFNLQEIAGKRLKLCPECTKLLHHALVKRTHCPRDPKPSCKHCPTHCYAQSYRQKIRQVMALSGRRLLLSGRLDYFFHLFF